MILFLCARPGGSGVLIFPDHYPCGALPALIDHLQVDKAYRNEMVDSFCFISAILLPPVLHRVVIISPGWCPPPPSLRHFFL